MPKSIRLRRIWNAVVMMVEPPGEPVARNGLPWLSRIVGAIELPAACLVPGGVPTRDTRLRIRRTGRAGSTERTDPRLSAFASCARRPALCQSSGSLQVLLHSALHGTAMR